MTERADVVIMGGGLAGLSLALQLRARFPSLDITVLERLRHPVPPAAHKVGESTVEIGAHYFEAILGLGQHLREGQLKKFGFRFFFSAGRRDVDQVAELGASSYLATPTYQLDRGIFENFLGQHALRSGVRFVNGARVIDLDLGDNMQHQGARHAVSYECDAGVRHISARWLIDASGRAGLIKRRLGLQESNDHDANAVWFRIASRIDVDEWSHDSSWLSRCSPPLRWLSTNHLVGEGYWVWLIPLSSGSHSVGIVADARLHPLRTMNTYERALDWMHVHQPRLAEELDTRRDQLQDFLFLRRFSYGCKQVFSAAGWALTGEAGVFLDPFYSPGSDFIAISNTFITELIAKDLAGEPVAPHARLYEQLYFSFYRSTLSLYVDQYPMFGDPEVMPVKVIWDYAYYWGVLCQLFFQQRLTDTTMLGQVRGELATTLALNTAMQSFLRAWARVSAKHNGPLMIDQAALGWFVELNRGLRDSLDDEAFRARMRATCAQLHTLAAEILERALAKHPQLDAAALRALLQGIAVEPRGELLLPRAA
ncbi:MAG TPA: NAD(P)/FAD-dependent oxidoreductase [Steroidobacteraceae bacterium]|nr:NAD(P)/FAD-dependent oxidoreductase [Steroidobacteraceae bacterium]